MEPCCGPSSKSRSTLETRFAEGMYCLPSADPCLFCESVIPVDAEILKAERILASLLQKKAELKWRFGSFCNGSIIHRIPPEITAIIFEIYVKNIRECGDRKARTSGPLFLGSVCRTWRQIAWKTASLWTTLQFGFSGNNLSNELQIAVEWLDRAMSLPLSIELRQKYSSYKSSPEGCCLILDTIIGGYGHHCRSLTLSLPEYLLASIKGFKHLDSSILDVLDVNSGHCTVVNRDGGPQLCLGSHVSPTKITINSFCFKNIIIDCRNLTSLTGTRMTLNELLDIFKVAPMLKSCTQKVVSFDPNYPLPMNILPIVHSRLEDLSIDVNYDLDVFEEISPFLQNLAFPSLKRFTYVDNIGRLLPIEALADFLGRSSCSLQTVSLEEAYVLEDDLSRIFRRVPFITNLHLASKNHDCPFIHALAAPPRQGDISPPDEPLLPFLQRLSIEAGPTFAWNLLPRFFAPFSDAPKAQARPLTQVDICCSHITYYFHHEAYSDLEIPLISQDVLGQLSLLSKVDFKLQFKRKISSYAEDLVKVSNDHWDALARFKAIEASNLNDNTT